MALLTQSRLPLHSSEKKKGLPLGNWPPLFVSHGLVHLARFPPVHCSARPISSHDPENMRQLLPTLPQTREAFHLQNQGPRRGPAGLQGRN